MFQTIKCNQNPIEILARAEEVEAKMGSSLRPEIGGVFSHRLNRSGKDVILVLSYLSPNESTFVMLNMTNPNDKALSEADHLIARMEFDAEVQTCNSIREKFVHQGIGIHEMDARLAAAGFSEEIRRAVGRRFGGVIPSPQLCN
jgi:hypothetical protein